MSVCVLEANIKNSLTHPTMPENVLWSPHSHGVTSLSAVEPPEAINAPVTARFCFVCQIFLSVVGAFAPLACDMTGQNDTVLMHPSLKQKCEEDLLASKAGFLSFCGSTTL